MIIRKKLVVNLDLDDFSYDINKDDFVKAF